MNFREFRQPKEETAASKIWREALASRQLVKPHEVTKDVTPPASTAKHVVIQPSHEILVFNSHSVDLPKIQAIRAELENLSA